MGNHHRAWIPLFYGSSVRGPGAYTSTARYSNARGPSVRGSGTCSSNYRGSDGRRSGVLRPGCTRGPTSRDSRGSCARGLIFPNTTSYGLDIWQTACGPRLLVDGENPST
jgi:hypothetical protein